MKKILNVLLFVMIVTLVWTANVKAADLISKFSVEKGTKTVMGKVFDFATKRIVTVPSTMTTYDVVVQMIPDMDTVAIKIDAEGTVNKNLYVFNVMGESLDVKAPLPGWINTVGEKLSLYAVRTDGTQVLLDTVMVNSVAGM